MKVEVEFEDLERIVFATSVIKQIENALVAYKHDPFVKSHLDYGRALNNLAAAMNQARRASAGTAIAWDGALTYQEANFLRQVNDLFDKTSEYLFIDGTYRLENPVVDQLASKGCIKIGQSIRGVIWPGDDKPSIRPLPNFQVVVTARGHEKLKAYDDAIVDRLTAHKE
jgi:hypothetical protein